MLGVDEAVHIHFVFSVDHLALQMVFEVDHLGLLKVFSVDQCIEVVGKHAPDFLMKGLLKLWYGAI